MTIYYGQDGYVTKVINIVQGVSIDDFISQGEAYIVGSKANVGRDKVINGAIVLAPESPSIFHIFDQSTFSWVYSEDQHAKLTDAAWANVRSSRQQLLAASDWTQYADVVLANKEAWATYRQALRDVTSQPDPFNIVWPVTP